MLTKFSSFLPVSENGITKEKRLEKTKMLTLFVAMIVLLLNLSVGSFRNTAQMKDQERLMHS
jgi:hypothetical protein